MKYLTFIYIISFFVYATDSSSAVIDDLVYEEIKLKAMEKGIPASFLKNTFSNESIVVHSVIPKRFARPYEKKTWEEYKKLFVTQARINNGAVFYKKKRKVLEKVTNHYGVDSFLILSIIGVESNYGSHHKEFTVFNSLYTQLAIMPKRARWAKTEMIEFLSYCYNDSVPPHSVFGSYAGAFGFGQFIPSSFNNFAVDFDEDGVRQAYTWPDVMASIANYLLKNGYPKNSYSNREEVYKSVYAYNHADNYVKAVLALRDELKKAVESEINSKG